MFYFWIRQYRMSEICTVDFDLEFHTFLNDFPLTFHIPELINTFCKMSIFIFMADHHLNSQFRINFCFSLILTDYWHFDAFLFILTRTENYLNLFGLIWTHFQSFASTWTHLDPFHYTDTQSFFFSWGAKQPKRSGLCFIVLKSSKEPLFSW